MSFLAYVVDLGDNSVIVINTSSNTVVATIPVDPSSTIPRFIALTPDGRFAYVTNYANILSVIDTSTNTLVYTIPLPVGNFSEGISITPNGNFAYVANSGLDNVSVVATATNTVVNTIPVLNSPYGVAITPDGNFVYVTNSGSDNVSVIRTTTNTVVATIPVGDAPFGIGITPDGNFAYVANSGQSVAATTVSVINTNTNTVVDTITVGLSPVAIAITPDGNFVYVTNGLSFSVSVIDTGTNNVIATIPVGRFPFDIAITPDGAFAYVTNFGDDTVSVIDTTANTVVTTFPVGEAPTGIAISGAGQELPNVSLTVTKADFPDPVKLGENVTYTINVTNNGPAEAQEVFITDTLPQGVEFIAASTNMGTCSESNGVVTCELGTMDISEGATVTVTVKPTTTGTICNKVVVTTGESAPQSCDNMAIQCTTVLETACIEVKKVFDSCTFEDVKQKTFRFPSVFKNQDFECRVIETKCEVLEINRTACQNLTEVKLRIEVVLEFRNQNPSSQVIKGTVFFEKKITLNCPEGTDICCDAKAICKSIQADDYEAGSCSHSHFKKIYCMVKVAAAVKCTKLVQIEVPVLGCCRNIIK